MAKHLSHVAKSKTPQTSPLYGEKQVKNNAGGYVYEIGSWKQAERFLILGSAAGTYYVGGQKLTRENAQVIETCAAENAQRMVDMIVDVSINNRAPSNDPAIFALGLIANRPEAKPAIAKVCRIGTHLFQFVEAVNELHSWNRSMRRAVAEWYTSKDLDSLIYQVTKYQQRDGMSHRDVFRLAHPQFSEEQQGVARWVACGMDGMGERSLDVEPFKPREYGPVAVPVFMQHLDELKQLGMGEINTKTGRKVAQMIRDYGFVREHVPTVFLNDPSVWEALLEKMPPMAMLRNLATMTRIGLLKPLSDGTHEVLGKLDVEQFRKARVHPMSILVGFKTYAAGHGLRGRNTWSPVSTICDRLDDLFYEAFNWIKPTKKRFLIGVDVSGSMTGAACTGCESMRASEAAAAMAMLIAKSEPNYHVVGFADRIRELNVKKSMDLPTVLKNTSNMTFGSTDCSLLMRYAAENNIKADCMIVITDNESFVGPVHPSVAMRQYRDKVNPDGKLIAMSVTATRYSIADPKDPGMLDITGFDASVPQILTEFVNT